MSNLIVQSGSELKSFLSELRSCTAWPVHGSPWHHIHYVAPLKIVQVQRLVSLGANIAPANHREQITIF
jgi:hypothetical protein